MSEPKDTAAIVWEEFINTLRQAQSAPSDNGFFTTRDISEITGLCEDSVRNMIRQGIQQGRIERGSVMRAGVLTGFIKRTFAYRVLPEVKP